MSREVEFETTVRGGLPVWVLVRLYPEEPDVGIFHEQAEVEDIQWLSGKTISDQVWASIPQADFDRIAEEAREGGNTQACDRADYLYEQMRDRKMEEECEAWPSL